METVEKQDLDVPIDMEKDKVCIPPTQIDTLCIGGGSIRGLCELGALHFYFEKNIFNNIKTFVGVSIGSVISLLMCIGLSPIDIFVKATEINEWIKFDIKELYTFKQNAGVLDISTFTQHIETIVKTKFGYIPTLKELKELTGKKLVVAVVNVSKRRPEYFDYTNEPDISCLEAIKMSCSMPLIFKRVVYKDNIWVDGGLLDNFPIERATKEGGNVMGICVEGGYNEDDSIIDYIHALFSLPINEIQKLKIRFAQEYGKCKILNITVKNTSPIDFKLAKKKKLEMFYYGYKYAENQG